jgi:hypothetical protein
MNRMHTKPQYQPIKTVGYYGDKGKEIDKALDTVKSLPRSLRAAYPYWVIDSPKAFLLIMS